MVSGWVRSAVVLVALSVAAGAESIRIDILEGDGAINNIRLQRAKEPVIRVETETGAPVAGAVVHFLAPATGPGGTFLNGSASTTTQTDNEGRANAPGLRPNKIAGQFQIRVTASHLDQSASARITQTNAEPAIVTRNSSKKIAILAILGGAVAGGAALSARGGGGGGAAKTPAAATGTVVVAGTPSFGAP